MFGRTVALVFGVLLAISMASFRSTAACGWSGDAEFRAEAEGEVVVVGADGRPLSDDEMLDAASAAWETELGNRYRTGEGVAR